MDDEDKHNLLTMIMGFGYSAVEAIKLVEFKSDNYDIISKIVNTIDMNRWVPLHMLLEAVEGFNDKTDDEKNALLWSLGFDTKNYKWCIDVMCYTLYGKRKCGKVIIGQERLDKQYLKMTLEGRKLASVEAMYHKDRDVLEVMRGNKKA